MKSGTGSKRTRWPIYAALSAAIVTGIVLISSSPVSEFELASQIIQSSTTSSVTSPGETTQTTTSSVTSPTTVLFASSTTQTAEVATTSNVTATTTTPSTTEAEPDPVQPPLPPSISSFTVEELIGFDLVVCSSQNARPFLATWTVAETTSVQLQTTSGVFEFAGNGDKVFCDFFGSSLTLVANGPGGSTSQTNDL